MAGGMNPIFHRVQLVTGEKAFDSLQETTVLIVGIGGVGSWCAEALVRSGIGNITIVDSDRVCVTNINRQLQATLSTVAEMKTEALRKRLLDLNPRCKVTAINKIYDSETAHEFDLSSFDYVIDCIDSLTAKIELIVNTLGSSATLYSALGAACKLDPTRIKVAPLKKSFGCPLAKLVRKMLRYRGISKPKFLTVFSDELLENHEGKIGCGTGTCVCPKVDSDDHEWCSSKKQINGSLVHITGMFGFHLASLVMQDVMNKTGEIKRIR